MTERTRREFMQESSAAIGFSLSDIFSGLFSSSGGEPSAETIDELFDPDDGILFERGPHPAHPYDTMFQDYFSMNYIEGIHSRLESLQDYDPDEKEVKSLVARMDKLRELPEDHPVRRMSELTPEPSPLDPSNTSLQEAETIESKMKDVIREAVHQNDGDWYDTWEKMEQDVDDVKKNVFEYNDIRRHHDNKLEIRVDNSAELPNSYTNAFFNNEVYHGEKFDAEIIEDSVFIRFHNSEFYASPEKILSEDEYKAVRNGNHDYSELDRDQKAIFNIYQSSPLEKIFNFT